MQAKDVMTASVVTATPETEVAEIARRLVARNISAMPIVDAENQVVGIVSEGDLMRRAENETERRPSWWIRAFTSSEDRARDFLKTHGKTARDIMSRNVISVSEDTELAEIAETLEKHHIKRVTVLRDGKLVGIVSRANLLRGLVAAGTKAVASDDDRDLKAAIEKSAQQAGLNLAHISVVVADGVATIWGMVETEAERAALALAAEEVGGIEQVENNVKVMPTLLRATMGAQ